MKRYPVLAVAASALIFLASCSKEPLNNLTDDESRIYITNHDSTANFASFKTFSIADSVAIIQNNKLVEKDRSDMDAQFINAVAAAMKARGFTQVTRDQNPDVGINISQVNNTYTGLVSYTDYYGGYGGYWDPYYWGYGGYPYYGGYTGIYQVNEGALLIDMFDLKDASNSGKLKSVWSGLIRGEGIYSNGKATDQVNTLFSQSAYITTNQ
jgi:Domain of unknown function (DUF4136)